VKAVGSFPLVLLDDSGHVWGLEYDKNEWDWFWKKPGQDEASVLVDPPVGGRFVDVGGDAYGVVYLDSAGGVRIRARGGYEPRVPPLPAGVSYVDVETAGEGAIAILLRSDGIVVCVSLYGMTWVGVEQALFGCWFHQRVVVMFRRQGILSN
jgi:hypothetical protein